MKRITILTFIFTSVMSTQVMSENSDVGSTNDFTLGLSSNKLSSGSNSTRANGINVTYSRTQKDNKLGFIVTSNITYKNKDVNFYNYDNVDFSQLSISSGPIYHITDNISMYGTIGLSASSVDAGKRYYDQNSSYDMFYNKKSTYYKDSLDLIYGAGIRVSPDKNVVINLGIEKSSSNLGESLELDMIIVSLGAGIRF
ncbi:Ail/Lom family outer membrane beta-barrel protein [Aliivibrio fischeri]|uniref:Outer membrane protein beta-barrel domain-containing protein n=1 Tax=Aliivibrio fischeri TaxID=668 RepID=A0A510UMR1_ALIFS|nr:Ail/Lom family outer membrane beta-barrel protein [Aliivibrio fischeri]MUK28747.1 Ail/Lom family outer membrane beta-barrel protein [Aliivibrio fischeri]GEK15963.1 hypothetical protein AFI02nite_39990 [Aliivibrio fischeri]